MRHRFIVRRLKQGTGVLAGVGTALFLSAGALIGAQSAASREDLRRLVRLPQIHFSVGVTFNKAGLLAWQHERPDPDEVAAVRKSLRDEPADAERLLRLGQLLREAGDSAAAVAAYSNAVRWLRPRVAQRPGDGLLLARLGEALDEIGERAEAEVMLRRAARAAPKESASWVALGRFLTGMVLLDLMPETQRNEKAPDLRFLELLLSKYKPPGPHFEQAERHAAEALESFDRAVSLAPKDPAPLEQRAACRATLALLRFIKQNVSRAQPDLQGIPFVFMSPDCVPDLRRAAELAPTDARRLGTVAFFEMFSSMFLRKDDRVPQMPDIDRLWENVPPDTVKSVRAKIVRLGELAQSPSAIRAAEAAEALGLLEMTITQNPSGAEANLRRAVALNPKGDHAWDALALVLAMEGRSDALLSVCEARLKVRPTARNHFFVAKAYEKLNRWDKVLEQTRAAVQQDSGDFLAQSSLVIALLHQGTEPALNEAGQHLVLAVKLVNQASDEQKVHLKFTSGATLALAGQLQEAREVFEGLLADDKNHSDARAALAIVAKW